MSTPDNADPTKKVVSDATNGAIRDEDLDQVSGGVSKDMAEKLLMSMFKSGVPINGAVVERK